MDLKQPQRASTATLLAGAAALVLALVLASVATLYWLQGNEIARLDADLTSAKASARKAWSKVYDMQEAEEKAESEEMDKLRVQLWEAQQKLEKCKP